MSPAVTAKLVEVLDSSFLRALAEPSRLEILKVLLERGPSDVGTVAAYVPQERSVVSRHLKVLLDAQIVTSARRGRHRVLAVDGQAILVRFERILALASDGVRRVLNGGQPKKMIFIAARGGQEPTS